MNEMKNKNEFIKEVESNIQRGEEEFDELLRREFLGEDDDPQLASLDPSNWLDD